VDVKRSSRHRERDIAKKACDATNLGKTNLLPKKTNLLPKKKEQGGEALL
jgi:hypothetical protein